MPANDIIQAWLLKSAHDLQTAQIVASHLPDFDDTIAFHCQQSIEKALKGYLVYLDIEFKKSLSFRIEHAQYHFSIIFHYTYSIANITSLRNGIAIAK